MGKDYTHIKANGLRNELKDIRKSIDKLTNVLEIMLELQYSLSVKQTHKQYEKSTISPCAAHDHDSERFYEEERYGEGKGTQQENLSGNKSEAGNW